MALSPHVDLSTGRPIARSTHRSNPNRPIPTPIHSIQTPSDHSPPVTTPKPKPRTVLPHHRLHLPRRLQVGRVGHAVRDDGRLQRHHGRVGREGLGHVGGDAQVWVVAAAAASGGGVALLLLLCCFLGGGGVNGLRVSTFQKNTPTMAGRPPPLQPPTAAVDDDRGRTSSRRIGGVAAPCLPPVGV